MHATLEELDLLAICHFEERVDNPQCKCASCTRDVMELTRVLTRHKRRMQRRGVV